MSKLRAGSEYIPLTSEEDMSRARLVVPFPRLGWVTISLPFLAFVFCIVWSVVYDFEHSTATHCKVYNFLPSVSAAIGHYRPQRDVWKTAIALQAIVRSMVFVMYKRYYSEHVDSWAKGMSNFALLMYALENTSLVTLSFWTSYDNYAFHKLSFITFLFTSFIHMFLMYFILNNCCNLTRESSETTSLKWKWRAMLLNTTSIVMACYFFYRHNKYCEPLGEFNKFTGNNKEMVVVPSFIVCITVILVYSMFALSEYSIVLSNMVFHLTAVWDFPVSRILISGSGLRII